MTRWRTFVILFFFAAPVLVFIGFGGWALWQTGQLLWLWFTLPLGWAVAFLLARWWGEKLVPLQPEELKQPRYWTPRDKKAWALVEERIQSAAEVDQEELVRLQFYVDVSRDLAEDVARFYFPKATDPVASLTIPEMLAAAQLALEDLAELYDRYVPGGRWLTIKNWRTLSKLPKRYKLVSNLLTAGAAFFSPIAAAGRYVASRTVMDPVGRAIQSNLLTWFYTMFLQRVGFYLIEMNSGRLRGGKDNFREAFERFRRKDRPWEDRDATTAESGVQSSAGGIQIADVGGEGSETGSRESAAQSDSIDALAGDAPSIELDRQITVCLAGQSGAGRGSLVRALLADADRPAETLAGAASVTVHRIQLHRSDEQLQLLDTAGYGGEESSSIRKDRFRAMAASDLVLLVMNVASPARDADLAFLNAMQVWFDEQPQLKPPPVLAVLTHIDLLKPPMEWSPPYDWRKPASPKEHSIRDAVEHVRREFHGRIVDAVPVCSDVERGRVYGVREWLEPEVANQLEDAAAVGSLRTLHDKLESGKVSRILNQVWNLGKALRGK